MPLVSQIFLKARRPIHDQPVNAYASPKNSLIVEIQVHDHDQASMQTREAWDGKLNLHIRPYSLADRLCFEETTVMQALLLLVLCVDQIAEPLELPKSVQTWRAARITSYKARVTVLENNVNVLQKEKAKTTAQKKDLAKRIKAAEAELKDRVESGPSFTLGFMEDQPNVGDLGFLETAVTVQVIDDTTAIIKRPESLTFVGADRRGTAVKYYEIMITGVSTTDWPNGREIKLKDYFEATHVDKKTRLVVVQPFDYKKWQAILEKESTKADSK